MSDKKTISDDDLQLFKDSVGDVIPIKKGSSLLPKSKPKPVPQQRLEDERRVVDELLTHDYDPLEFEQGDELIFQRPGLRKIDFRKLRRGQYAIQKELDLHGYFQQDAKAALTQFLTKCRNQSLRCVRIIHGKGKSSEDSTPKIKPLVNGMLRQNAGVLAFCSARPVDGGTGAVYVLLKK